MNTHALSLLTVTTLTLGTAHGTRAQSFWINEFHYDNTSTDTGEFVEVIAPATFADLASVKLTLYNGADGTPYGTTHALSTFTPGETVSGLTVYSKLIGGLQNGAPDGLSLDVGGDVRHFISYEGGFTATAGPAAGRTSFAVPFVENDFTAPGSSIGLTGLGSDLAQFTWDSTGFATPGTLNVGQSVSVVPEPSSYAVAFGLGLGVFGVWRRRRLAPVAPVTPRPAV